MPQTELNPYPAYRNSGVEWLGDVPAHWETQRLKSVAGNISEQTLKRPKGMGYIALEHVESWTGRVTCEGAEPGDGQLKRFRPGDVLFGKLRPYLAKVVHAKSHGLCVGEFFVLRTRRAISPRFLEYVLRSTPSIEWINSSTFGARMPRADWAFIGGMRFPVPAPTEQAAIARFLDHATSRIDRYIRAKEKLIALLEEQKQAIINEVVTGRIDVRTGRPYAAYKPSGVESLGDVPAHWGIRKVRQCGTVTGGMTPSMAERRFWDGGIPWVTPKDMKAELIDDSAITVSRKALDETSLTLLPTPVVIIVVRGMILARKVPVAVTTSAVTINQDMKAICPNAGILAEFLAGQMTSAQGALMGMVDEAGHGTRRLPTERWVNLELCIPPRAEQDVIVVDLRNKNLAINTTVDQVTRQLHALRQYRARLIADVVTGKLDVRGTAPALPRQAEMTVADLAET